MVGHEFSIDAVGVVDSHEREKHLLLDEIGQLKREKELLDRSLVNKDSEILDIHQQLEASSSAARTADNKIRLLESQVLTRHSVHCLNQSWTWVPLGPSTGRIGLSRVGSHFFSLWWVGSGRVS